MEDHAKVALVTVAVLFTYLGLVVNVARTRKQCGISAPAMTGDPRLERAIRIHYNTLEWLPVFLAAMWLFAVYWDDWVAAGLGLVWIVGRLIYAMGYMADPAKRAPGFLIQALATFVLLFGAAGRLIWLLATGVAV
jgi:uncharacterized membrane protein YecN with MAPEG domain